MACPAPAIEPLWPSEPAPAARADRPRQEQGQEQALLACLRVAPDPAIRWKRGILADEWLRLCRRLTPAVERVSARCALLDLGWCAPDEAQEMLHDLMKRLARRGLVARAGVGPSLALAQLAAYTATRERPLVLVTADTAAALLRHIPVSALSQLYPPAPVTPEIVARLGGYGLTTFWHLARLGEPMLRRQFGAVGGWLARMAAGQDERPLHPTPRPVRSGVRLRLRHPATPERILRILPPLCQRVASQLRQRQQQGRVVAVRVRWECGCVQSLRRGLRQHMADPAVLTQEVRRQVMSLLQSHGARPHPQAIEELRVALTDFAPTTPQQATFWRTRQQRQVAMELLSASLTQRHGQPLLFRVTQDVPAAIFAEERHHLDHIAPGAAEPTSAARAAPVSPGHAGLPTGPWRDVPHRLHWW